MQLTSWSRGLTRYQWLVLFVAWLGWVFAFMCVGSLVMLPITFLAG